MSSGRLQEIERLFQAASKLPPDQRGAFLHQSCAGDEELRQEVESLLSYEQAAEGFMESPALEGQAASLAEDLADDPSLHMAGRTLGRYQIHDQIGVGGMGVVYRAQDTYLNRPVALKILPQDATADEDRKLRFVREARAASALNDPNIVTIYDIGQAAGLEFIAMEYVQGQTLRDLISRRELPICEALDYAVQIARALAVAHTAGIIHRDIKPANIMISGASPARRQVKILDFGIAKLSETKGRDRHGLTAITSHNIIIGTAAYMSPEQAEGRPVDARSDIFSFGAVLYKMLSGRRAFEGQSSLSTLAAILRADPEPLKGVSPELQRIVSRCLRKDPNLRFQRTDELRQALDTCLQAYQGSAPTLKSIAVLPFANLSPDVRNQYFCEGLAEEIINSLAKLPGLQVTARTSAFGVRAQDLDIREIGAKLNVEYILEGSVREAGSRIRVTAQLINVASGYQLWSERYDREMTDVFAIQDEIALAIVNTLRVHLTKGQPLVKRHTGNPEAYTLYFKGRHYLEKRTPEAYAKAKECFEQALAEDANYAQAFLGLAEFYWLIAIYGFQYPRDSLVKAKEATIRALQIDDTSAEGHAILGSLLGVGEFDWKGADRAFQRALDLDPNSPVVSYRQGCFYLWPLEQPDDATAAVERTLALDPLSAAPQWILGYFSYCRRHVDRAIKHLLAVIELEPAFFFAYSILGLAHLLDGNMDEAVQAARQACEVAPGNTLAKGIRAYVLGKAGRPDETRRLVDQLHNLAQETYVSAKSFMFAWAGLGDWDRAMAYLIKSAEEERDPMTVMNLTMEPFFDPLRTDPRYKDLLSKLNLRT